MPAKPKKTVPTTATGNRWFSLCHDMATRPGLTPLHYAYQAHILTDIGVRSERAFTLKHSTFQPPVLLTDAGKVVVQGNRLTLETPASLEFIFVCTRGGVSKLLQALTRGSHPLDRCHVDETTSRGACTPSV